jgi:hypothetical protein
VHCANRSAFKLFGALGSDDPVCGGSLSYERSGWGFTAHATEEVGSHDPTIEFGSYYGAIGSKEWEKGNRTVTLGLEYFHSDRRVSQAYTFLSPFGSLSYEEVAPGLDITLGASYLGTHDTEWEGERFYGYADFFYSVDLGPWSLGGSIGGVLGNEGRKTLYVEPKVERDLTESTSAFASALWAYTDDVTNATIPPTITVGGLIDF